MEKIHETLVGIVMATPNYYADITSLFLGLKEVPEFSTGSYLVGHDGRRYKITEITARISPPELIITVDGYQQESERYCKACGSALLLGDLWWNECSACKAKGNDNA